MKSRSQARLSGTVLGRVAAAYRKSVLPNGLRIVTEEIPHVRSVSVGIWIDNGSRDESPDLNGISHFIEHMLFKGTTHRSVREIAESIESVGGYMNAFTGKEHTCYYARVLDEHLPLALDVLSDLVMNPTFPSRELEKEKGVVIEELKQTEDDPDDVIHDYFEKELFGAHALGYPVLGTEANIRAWNRRTVAEFRSRRYTASRIVVAAAGNLRHDAIVRLAEKAFRHIPTNGDPGPVARVPAPSAAGSSRRVFSRPIQQAHITMGTTGCSVMSEQRFPLMVLNTLLGDGMSSRLFQNIREKYGFAYTVYSFANMISDTGTVGAYIGTDTAHIDRCIGLIWDEFNRLVRTLVPRQELARTKEQLKGNMMLSLENIPNRMMRLGSAELYFGEFMSLDAMLRRIEAVTPDDLREVARSLFRPERFTTVIFKPNGAAAPSAKPERDDSSDD